MSASWPCLAMLRSVSRLRPSTLRYCVSFSQSARHAVQHDVEDKNLVASRTAPSQYPPPSMSSLPRPLESRSSHRTSQPTKVRDYPDRNPETYSRAPITTLPDPQCAPHLPYFVSRTRTNGLPVYLLSKRGGNMKQTRLKKVDGDVHKLRDEVVQALGLPAENCEVNKINGHVVLKGWYKPQLEVFLRERKF